MLPLYKAFMDLLEVLITFRLKLYYNESPWPANSPAISHELAAHFSLEITPVLTNDMI